MADTTSQEIATSQENATEQADATSRADPNQENILVTLADELKLRILYRLSTRDALRLCNTCNGMFYLAQDAAIRDLRSGDCKSFYFALKSGHLEMVKFCLEHGASVNAFFAFDWNWTALEQAVRGRLSFPIVKLLVEAGGQYNSDTLASVLHYGWNHGVPTFFGVPIIALGPMPEGHVLESIRIAKYFVEMDVTLEVMIPGMQIQAANPLLASLVANMNLGGNWFSTHSLQQFPGLTQAMHQHPFVHALILHDLNLADEAIRKEAFELITLMLEGEKGYVLSWSIVPLVTESILPHSTQELVDLLLDSIQECDRNQWLFEIVKACAAHGISDVVFERYYGCTERMLALGANPIYTNPISAPRLSTYERVVAMEFSGGLFKKTKMLSLLANARFSDDSPSNSPITESGANEDVPELDLGESVSPSQEG
ncbi:hypothetical protein B0T24DRAFT_673906 [Lasiosphaeria ovina]|uniref:Uncharacterized protein n=1 Tax=Lasiosphaeria ovina TaxID=92902 RepID=A0AAE0TYE3_9PEZI|nr:hypothetical protein B0T24DRAFT_673906 [Lasiosphaeria ovina]